MNARGAMVALAIAACAGEPTSPPPAPVAAAPAPPRAAVVARAAWIGVTTPAEAVDVAPSFDGVVATLAARPGDAVAAGAVLATLDERRLREDVDGATAALREAAARVVHAEVEVDRARHKLRVEEVSLAAGTTPAVAVEDARLAVRASEAAAAEARAARGQVKTQLERVRNRLGDTAVRAPFAGTIAARYADVGAVVGPQAPLVRLVGGGQTRLRFAVPLDQRARLAVGVRVVATLDGGAARPAVIAAIAPELDQASQLVYVDADLLEADPPAAPGLPATVRCDDPRCAAASAHDD